MKKRLLSALLLFGMAFCYAADFTCAVRINSSSTSPSLIFGCGEDKQLPFPPASDAFNVKDFYLVNESVSSGDLSRLGTDVRKNADSWEINCFNADGTLYFAAESGTLPTLNYAYSRNGEITKGTVEDGQLKVYAGTIVTLSTAEIKDEDVSEADASQYAVKTTSEEYGGEVYETEAATLKLNESCENININVTVPTSEVIIQLKGSSTGYYRNGTKIAELPSGYNGYVLCLTLDDKTTFVSMTGGAGYANVVLSVANATREAETLTYQVIATDSNLGNMQATITETDDKDNTLNQTAVRAVVPTDEFNFDFDGNGEVNYNDALFFYNYVAFGGQAMSYEQIMAYANEDYTDDLERDAETAFDYFENLVDTDNLQALSLISGEEITSVSDLLNSATLFYNYAAFNGMVMDASQVMAYTSLDPDDEDDYAAAEEACEKLDEVFVAK